MIKKHMCISSCMLAILMLITAVFTVKPNINKSYAQGAAALPEAPVQGMLYAAEINPADIAAEKAAVVAAMPAFAKEPVPMHNVKVRTKLVKILAEGKKRHAQNAMLRRKAAKWFPVVEPVLAKYGIPNDFKYVTLVEAGFGAGTSPKGARGIWQFMPGTARNYGLKVNGSVDERLDFKKSTDAAARYIKELYGVLHNWTLVAAAYNVGDNHLKKQMRRQDERSYYRLKLNKETAGYVYKLLGMKSIVERGSHTGTNADIHLYKE